MFLAVHASHLLALPPLVLRVGPHKRNSSASQLVIFGRTQGCGDWYRSSSSGHVAPGVNVQEEYFSTSHWHVEVPPNTAAPHALPTVQLMHGVSVH